MSVLLVALKLEAISLTALADYTYLLVITWKKKTLYFYRALSS
jgi:hypothetical protein